MTQSVKLGTALWLPTLVLICGLCSAAQSTGSAVSKGQFAETIERIRTEKNPTVRANNAGYLAEFTRSIDPKKVDDATLREIVSLLNTDDDGVRMWVAAALGNLGPRARIAVPTLLSLLRKVDCLEGDLTSAGAIRLALSRIGETPPPERKCVPGYPPQNFTGYPPSVYMQFFQACSSDKPCTRTGNFRVDPVPKGCCILTVSDGNGPGEDEVRSFEVFLNGKSVASSDHSPNAQATVAVQTSNRINVILTGEPSSKVLVLIAYDPRQSK
jgi:hypothetical protein